MSLSSPQILLKEVPRARGERFDYSETRLSANGSGKTTPKLVLLPFGSAFTGLASLLALQITGRDVMNGGHALPRGRVPKVYRQGTCFYPSLASSSFPFSPVASTGTYSRV